jgi:hypothetical protein
VVHVPVREANGFNGREPDAEPARVLEPDLGGGSDVKEDRALFGAAPPCDQRREAVAGEAQMPPGLDAVMAVPGRKRAEGAKSSSSHVRSVAEIVVSRENHCQVAEINKFDKCEKTVGKTVFLDLGWRIDVFRQS